VTIPDSVTTIGYGAFQSCTALTSVTIPDSVTTIEGYSFYYCTSLTYLTIPNSVTTIGDWAFTSCSSLTSVTIPGSVTIIGEGAFAGCTSITSIIIESGATIIGGEMFSGCTSLTSVIIPSSVTTIEYAPFSGCTSLTAIIVNVSNPNYASVDGVLYNKTITTLIQCPGGKIGDFTIPNSVTSIGDIAFSGCTSLTSVTIPISVTFIGGNAFYHCTSLTSVTIPNSITTIPGYAFYECVSLTSVTIPSSVTYIENGAFRDCASLTSISFLGFVAPVVSTPIISGIVWDDWIWGTGVGIEGHAYADSNFPAPGGDFYGLMMGAVLLGVPSPPTNFTATPGNSQVVLTWSTPTNDGGSTIINYTLYRSATSGGTYALIDSLSSLTFADTGLTNGQIYWYKVSAVNALGESPQAGPISVTPATIPTAPQNLAAVGGVGKVTLTWQAPSDPGGSTIVRFDIYRGLSEETILASPIGNVTGGILTYQDKDVTAITIYYYLVKAANAFGSSPASNIANGTTPAATVPEVPKNIAATPIAGMVTVTWQAPDSDGGSAITGYNLYRSTIFDGSYSLIASLSGLTHTDIGLTNGQTYWYKVSAVNAIGEGANCTAVSVIPYTTPNAPTGLTAIPGNAQVMLSWIAPADDGSSAIDHYVIYRDGADVAHPTTTTVTISGLMNGHSYSFTVAAHNLAGISAQSTAASATILNMPSAPQALTAMATSDKATLTWQAPSNNGGTVILSYQIYRSIGEGTYSQIGQVNGSVLTYVDTSVTAGTTYSYYVIAVNSIGAGAQPTSQSVTTPTDNNLLYASIGIVMVLVVIIGAFWYTRSKKKTPPQTPPQSPPQEPPKSS